MTDPCAYLDSLRRRYPREFGSLALEEEVVTCLQQLLETITPKRGFPITASAGFDS